MSYKYTLFSPISTNIFEYDYTLKPLCLCSFAWETHKVNIENSSTLAVFQILFHFHWKYKHKNIFICKNATASSLQQSKRSLKLWFLILRTVSLYLLNNEQVYVQQWGKCSSSFAREISESPVKILKLRVRRRQDYITSLPVFIHHPLGQILSNLLFFCFSLLFCLLTGLLSSLSYKKQRERWVVSSVPCDAGLTFAWDPR